jgi:hypothetical protein
MGVPLVDSAQKLSLVATMPLAVNDGVRTLESVHVTISVQIMVLEAPIANVNGAGTQLDGNPVVLIVTPSRSAWPVLVTVRS